MEERTLPWWRRVLKVAWKEIRSGFGLFGHAPKDDEENAPVATEQEPVQEEDSEKVDRENAELIEHFPEAENIESAATEAAAEIVAETEAAIEDVMEEGGDSGEADPVTESGQEITAEPAMETEADSDPVTADEVAIEAEPEPVAEKPLAQEAKEEAIQTVAAEEKPVDEAAAEAQSAVTDATLPEQAEPTMNTPEPLPEESAPAEETAAEEEIAPAVEAASEQAEVEAESLNDTEEKGASTDDSSEMHHAGAEAPRSSDASYGPAEAVPLLQNPSPSEISAVPEAGETLTAAADDQPAAVVEIASEHSTEEVAEPAEQADEENTLEPAAEIAPESTEETQLIEEAPEESSSTGDVSETHPAGAEAPLSSDATHGPAEAVPLLQTPSPSSSSETTGDAETLAGAEAPVNYEIGVGTDESVPFQNPDSNKSLSAATENAETQSATTNDQPAAGIEIASELLAAAADDQPVTVENDTQKETPGEPAAATTEPESTEAVKKEEAKEPQPAKHFIKLEPREGDANASPFSVIVSQVYDGPLELLLDLIRKQDIDIYDIPIARITAQFLAYVDQLKATDVDVAGEFIYTAALLIHIKSKLLLPRAPAGPTEEAEDPRRELVERLLEHERFKNAAQMLQQKQLLEAATWTNPGIRDFRDDEGTEPEIAADTVDLVRVFRDILERARNRPTINVEEDSVTVAQMIQFLTRRLTMEDKPIALRRLLGTNRTEHALIAMFLALLELVRLQAILLRQDLAFSDIFIKKNTGFEAVMNEGLASAQDDWR
jgi:segregation and condensation protein A